MHNYSQHAEISTGILYAQHLHVCTTYTYTVYIFATFNLCTDKNPVKSHYTVLPEGEVPINYKFQKFRKGIAKNNDNILKLFTK